MGGRGPRTEGEPAADTRPSRGPQGSRALPGAAARRLRRGGGNARVVTQLALLGVLFDRRVGLVRRHLHLRGPPVRSEG